MVAQSQHGARSSSHAPRRNRLARWGKRLALGTALAAGMWKGGKDLYLPFRTIAERETAKQQRTIEQNIRPRDLHEARKTVERWHGLRDMDEIVYQLAESFPERQHAREIELKKYEPRQYMSRSPEEMNDEMARLSPKELDEAMKNFREGGFNSRQLQEWKTEIESLRGEMQTYFRELDQRAPARVKKKIRWMYMQLLGGSGLAALGLYLALQRRMKNRNNPRSISKNARD